MQDIIIFFIFVKNRIMKIFKVSIDNNPGGWKSGPDPSVLVPANNVEDAISKGNRWLDRRL